MDTNTGNPPSLERGRNKPIPAGGEITQEQSATMQWSAEPELYVRAPVERRPLIISVMAGALVFAALIGAGYAFTSIAAETPLVGPRHTLALEGHLAQPWPYSVILAVIVGVFPVVVILSALLVISLRSKQMAAVSEFTLEPGRIVIDRRGHREPILLGDITRFEQSGLWVTFWLGTKVHRVVNLHGFMSGTVRTICQTVALYAGLLLVEESPIRVRWERANGLSEGCSVHRDHL